MFAGIFSCTPISLLRLIKYILSYLILNKTILILILIYTYIHTYTHTYIHTYIERKREANFLGLFINEHMNWNTHIFNITKTITKPLGVMNRLKHYLPQSVLQILYNSLILSHLNSNITAWGFAAHKLCRLQKRALRLITDSKYNAHTKPLLKV